MKHKDAPTTRVTSGVFVYDVLPLPDHSHGPCHFCGADITAQDGQVVKVVVVCGIAEFFHLNCMLSYANGLQAATSVITDSSDAVN